ncbi:hypothetical protein HK414_22345 [Ramlibacter terrae]|uniref:3-hydroxyacyl-CoA dehydrogenase C-terminal domain-containing protein n=1 Tax=Ramlibacter terrae TaxID=2732511 RepID=A0ABX6P516_9BURK|nr:hypothetical protein HK414_22345 [Ramlibacter terrae]
MKAGRSRPAETERVAAAVIDVEGASAPLLIAALASASRRVPAVVHARMPRATGDAVQALDAIVRDLVAAGRMPQARAATARAAVQIMDAPAASTLRLVDAPFGDAASGVLLLADAEVVVPAGWVGVRALPDLLAATVVEVVRGSGSDAAHASRVYDWLQQLGKTPIAISDAPAGFLARLGRAAGAEGLALCREGFAPALVENASLQAGMAAGALTLAQRFGLGRPSEAISGHQSSQPLVQVREIRERLLFIQALEALRCLDEAVVASARDANLAALQGLGFPAWTGGAIQYANHYGLGRFCERSDALAARHGHRFAPPALLRRMVADRALAVEP